MKLQVGRRKTSQVTVNPVTKELQILQDGSWVPAKDAAPPPVNQPFIGIGKFEPIEVSKDKLSEILLQLNAEKFSHPYHVEKQGDKYFII